MFLGLGIPELVIILVVVLIIFGPKNLPKLGKSLGKTVKSVREGIDEGEAESKTDDAAEAEQAAPAQAIPAEVTEVVYCTKCGGENEASAAFCKHCGNKLN